MVASTFLKNHKTIIRIIVFTILVVGGTFLVATQEEKYNGRDLMTTWAKYLGLVVASMVIFTAYTYLNHKVKVKQTAKEVTAPNPDVA